MSSRISGSESGVNESLDLSLPVIPVLSCTTGAGKPGEMTGGKDMGPCLTELPSPITPGEPLTQLHHKSKDHYYAAFALMNRMRLHGQLCDIKLRSLTTTVQAHKLVLSAASPYFHAMFNDDLSEKRKDEILIHDVDPLALTLLVDFAYTGEIVVTEENVQVLLPASSLLQMHNVREISCKFLLRQLHPTNCLGIRTFADTHACQELQKRSHKFALQNFQEVMNTEEFLLLPFQQVDELISNSQLNVDKEEKVFQACIAWVKHDLTDRKQYIYKLLKHVRLPLVSREFLMTHVDSENLVRETPECKELLLEAMRYHLLPEQRTSLASYRTSLRKPEGSRSYMFAIGGGSLFAIHSECEVYSPVTERWVKIAPMSTRRSRAGVAGINNVLYAVGGYDGTNDLSSGEAFNPQTNKWTSITPMGTRRSCLGVSTLDGLMFCCGGYDGAACLSSVERYDPITSVWSSCPAMCTRRRYCRVAVLDSCIYAMGGFDSANYQSSVEKLDPRMGKWMSVPCMSSRRSSCGVASLDGYLYCVGGNDGAVCVASGERFNPRRNCWEPIATMHSRRSTHELCQMDGYLYSVGGNDGSSSLNTVERYDARMNKWQMVTAMDTRRSSVAAAVLTCVNIEKYL